MEQTCYVLFPWHYHAYFCNVMLVCVFLVLAMFLCLFGIIWLRYHACPSSMFLFMLSTMCSHACIPELCRYSYIAFVQSFCHRISEGPHYLLKGMHRGTMVMTANEPWCPNACEWEEMIFRALVSVKCICVMYSINIPSCIHHISSMIECRSIDQ